MLFSYENLHRHYLRCRRNKRNTINALRFEEHQELNLLTLREALETRTYRPAPSVCFVTQRPKLREIFAADFRDRVVHHVLVDSLERYWEPVFIHDSYACRQGKGTHAAVERLQGFIRQVTANGQRPAWYLQLECSRLLHRGCVERKCLKEGCRGTSPIPSLFPPRPLFPPVGNPAVSAHEGGRGPAREPGRSRGPVQENQRQSGGREDGQVSRRRGRCRTLPRRATPAALRQPLPAPRLRPD
ncbi:MAG TPA: hypothetical protein VES73_09265 [Lamprocystis sp. (in: g-proteobacteria)]|nr:hypothetical protein [Lamprocystis sp. (in: g-proteobacteria)]